MDPPVGRGGSALRVAVVHDYLTQRGGAERVALALLDAFPGARLITSIYDRERTFPEFKRLNVETTWLNRVPAFRVDPRRALPLLPTAFSGVGLDDVDLVVCSSSGWSHGVRTRAPKLVYCHNPARWLYQREQYVGEYGPVIRGAVSVLSPYLKWWDRKAAAGSTSYLANSSVVSSRIAQRYGLEAQIVPPGVALDPSGEQQPVAGLEPGFLLTIGRSRGYKNVSAVCAAVEGIPEERLVVVGDLPEGQAWSERIAVVSSVSDAELRWLYANCSGVVAASFEDFGLTPVEGFGFGKPALCLRAGGFLDTMREGITGFFFDHLEPAEIERALLELRFAELSPAAIREHARNYSLRAFRNRVRVEAQIALESVALDALSRMGPGTS